MANNEKTSPRVAKIASRLLKDPNSSADVKTIAGAVLTQVEDRAKAKPKAPAKAKPKPKAPARAKPKPKR